MDREILFRGKRLDNGQWAEGNYVKCDGKINPDRAYILPLVEYVCAEHQTIAIGGFVEVDPATVGQHTGLSDIGGKKIFEGDKCRVTRPCILTYGAIKFSNGCFWFVDDGPGGMLRLCDVKPNGFEIEVIGNVHDTQGGRP